MKNLFLIIVMVLMFSGCKEEKVAIVTEEATIDEQMRIEEQLRKDVEARSALPQEPAVTEEEPEFFPEQN